MQYLFVYVWFLSSIIIKCWNSIWLYLPSACIAMKHYTIFSKDKNSYVLSCSCEYFSSWKSSYFPIFFIYPPFSSLCCFFSDRVITLSFHMCLFVRRVCFPTDPSAQQWLWLHVHSSLEDEPGSFRSGHPRVQSQRAGLLPIVCFFIPTKFFLLLFRCKRGSPLCHQSLTGTHCFPVAILLSPAFISLLIWN